SRPRAARGGDDMVLALAMNDFTGATAFQLLLEGAWKATLLLVLAALVVLLLRRASAARRHLVWACALAGLVALPGMLVMLPAWRVRTPALDGIAPGFGLLANALEPHGQAALGEEPRTQARGSQNARTLEAARKPAGALAGAGPSPAGTTV